MYVRPAAMNHDAPVARLLLLGGARLTGATEIPRLERKTAAMLALLAVEGPMARSRIAGLLWPESRERTARNNLAQAVRRLCGAVGAPIVVGDEVLEPRHVSSDVADLQLLVHKAAFGEAAKLQGELLAGYDFADCADLEAWLRGARAHAARAWSRAALAESERGEAEGAFDEAIAWAERLVAADPLTESSHLRLARLWLARGDAPAAMRAYEQCRRILSRELGMRPSEAMLDVLRAIRAGRPAATLPRPAAASLPAAVLRPKRVGREREWAELEVAYAERRGVVVAGEPGVGKSRLVRDFCASKGGVAVFEGRPGDPEVPFATLARGLRALLAERKPVVPAWAQAELARILPELGEPPAAAGNKLRLFEAVASALDAAAQRGLAALVADDLQWVDRASLEVIAWVADRCWARELPLFGVAAYREGELSPERRARVDAAVRAGTASRLPLGPLGASDAAALLTTLEVPELEGRVASIVASSGGNPLFLLEIVRTIVGTPGSGSGDAPAVPVSERMKVLIRRRLERLSEGATRLARVAAVVGEELDVPLAAHVLDVSPLDLAEGWAELERAQVLSAGRFSHDLLAEAVREGIPAIIREHVHARTAEHLVRAAGDPARIAHHFLHGAREGEAVSYLLAAAESARSLSRVADAIVLYERAARILEEAGDFTAATEALYQRARSPMGKEGEAVVQRLERLARTPHDRARALCTRANVELARSHLEAAAKAAREALFVATATGDRFVEAEALQALLDAQVRAGALEDAAQTVELFQECCALLDDPEAVVASVLYAGDLLLVQDRPREALVRLEEALARLESWGKLRFAKARVLACIATAHLALGETEEAERRLALAEEPLAGASGVSVTEGVYILARARLSLAKRAYAEAGRILESRFADATPPHYVCAARVLRGELLIERGAVGDGARELAAIARDARVDPHVRVQAMVGQARAPASAGPSPAHVRFVEAHGTPSQRVTFACLRALALGPSRAEPLLAEAEATARALALPPLVGRVSACRAEVAWRAGRLDEARLAAEGACAAVARGELPGLDAERALAIRALASPEGEARRAATAAAYAYVTAPLADDVPSSERVTYLTAHANRRDVVSLAAGLGLQIGP